MSGVGTSTTATPGAAASTSTARSGDKGEGSNVGVMARSPAAYRFLKEQLTEERVRAHLTAEELTRTEPATGINQWPKYAERFVTPAIEAEIAATLTVLLSYNDYNYGESGLINALYNNDATVASATVEAGVATAQLSRSMAPGGGCRRAGADGTEPVRIPSRGRLERHPTPVRLHLPHHRPVAAGGRDHRLHLARRAGRSAAGGERGGAWRQLQV